MSYQALARKWRPRNFSELVGQTHVRTALENALSQGRLHPALLFSGTRGVGKTTLARIIARCLNCETGITATPCGVCGTCEDIEAGRFVDLIEVDAASRTKVEETRELLDNVLYAPAQGRSKVYLIDEVHMLSKSSFNALLKTLEEPPSHVQFLLATTDPQKLPITVLSRCLQFHLKRIAPQDIAQRMRYILGEEKLEADDDGLRRLARAADGSLRDGLSLLDQALAFGGGQVTGPSVAKMLGTIERRELLHLVQAMAQGDGPGMWAAIDLIDEQGLDFAEVLDELCRFWQRLAVGQQVPEAWDEIEREDLAPLVETFRAADLQVFYQIAVNARRDLDWAPDPRSGFEMAALRMLHFLPDVAGGGAGGSQGPLGQATSGKSVVAAKAASAQSVASVASAPTPKVEKPEAAKVAASESSTPKPVEQAAPALPALQVGALSWPAALSQLELTDSVRIVAQACTLQEQSAEHVTLRVGDAVRELCSPSVEQQLARALNRVLGASFQLRLDRTPVKAVAETTARNPEEVFLANPGVRKAMDMFDAQLQPGTLRISTDVAGSRSVN